MYAVVKTGGKQYQVTPGDTVLVEKLEGNPGDVVRLEEVLLLSGDGGELTLGRPLVQGAAVNAEIKDQGRHRKVIIYKYKRRKRYRRKAGHRQAYTALKITGIEGAAAASPAEPPAPAPAPAPADGTAD